MRFDLARLVGVPATLLRIARAAVRRRAPQGSTTPWPLGSELRTLLKTVRPYTVSDPLRLAMLHGLAEEVCAGRIEGDVVECGVYNGGSAAILASALRDETDRKLWLYDTFQGMPQPSDVDGRHAVPYAGQLIGSSEDVREVLGRVGFPQERSVVRRGLFTETFQSPLPTSIAFLHIDADWYDSVLLSLRTFYPLVSAGGVVVLDDYGHWEGARAAFYAFCRLEGVEPLIERAGYTQAFWRKGQEHTRDTEGRYSLGVYRPKTRVK